MFQPHNNLFHYTKARTFLDFILPSMTLKMGPYKEVNDPREARDWRFTVYLGMPDSMPLFRIGLIQQLSDEITTKTLVLCFSMDRPERDAPFDHRNSGYGHPRMWAQYGQNHAGVCLVLDRGATQVAVENALGTRGLYHGPVKYHRTIPDNGQNDIAYLEDVLRMGVGPFMTQHMDRFHREIFFTKHDDWRDETEFRWVFLSPAGEPVFVPIQDCLKAVIIGPYTDPEEEVEIVGRCRDAGIESHKMFHRGGDMHLVHQPPREGVCLDGIRFSSNIPSYGVFASAHDDHGQQLPLFIGNDGGVRVLPPE